MLIERNLRLVVYIARKFEHTGVEPDKLISIGTSGLIKGIDTYRADRSTDFALYASHCIENEILMYLCKSVSPGTEEVIDDSLNTDRDGTELLSSDVLGNESGCVL